MRWQAVSDTRLHTEISVLDSSWDLSLLRHKQQIQSLADAYVQPFVLFPVN
jgi:hypothetical protein